MPTPPIFNCFLTLAFFLMLPGCSGGTSGPTRLPVSGTVTVDEEPLELARIEFHPSSGDLANSPTAFGYVKDGKYEITEYAGAVIGPHEVIIRPIEVEELDEEAEEKVLGEFVTVAKVEESGENKFDFAFEQGEMRPDRNVEQE
ncbi:hypothetical protein [Rubinisphaera sp.]|mgnify:FL=1|uniref:hypothetical protein n=1 Tax=Rubinisphaera sp. TaxID=2024857 RepID=UPI0025DEF78A|nr:hypothetical protein [Rubinisphaera sp.]